MRDFNFQTGAILNDGIAQPLRRNPHIWSDVKITHSTLTDSHWNGERSVRNMRRHNEKWQILCPQIILQ